ncbi:MAG TPA: hypothetical protein VFX03_13215 [Thermomicrobiales bacterium]|nr:hypothetical protein [Thermomicrobiales bacterium]
MNDVQFSDTPLTTGMLADYCQRFPNSPACTHQLGGSGQGGNDNGGNGGHHDHHDHNDNHHGASHGGHPFHPLS